MSTFAVTIETIAEAKHHPNADSLDIISLESMDYSFVMGRDEVKPGDLIVYFPVDSLLPDNVKAILPEAIAKKLTGKQKNRIKTVELRGQIAQGLAWPLRTFPFEKAMLPNQQIPMMVSGTDLTELLGVIKYEGIEQFDQHGCMRNALSSFAPKYDIEGADRYKNVIEILKEKIVWMSEKVEGTNWSSVYDLNEEKPLKVQQRSFSIVPIEGKELSNCYWKTAQSQGLLDAIEKMAKDLNNVITLRGELLGPGIQENVYKLIKHKILIFDIMLDGIYAGYNQFMDLCDKFKLETVPILGVGKLWEILDGKTVQEYSNGKSLLNPDTYREGVVITPLEEFYIEHFGRAKIKQRSPLYLSKNNL